VQNRIVLRCTECHATAETFELGWASFYSQVPDEDPEPILVTFCARCARREFGSMLVWLTGRPTAATDSASAN
jgi:hypothetical protein